MIIKCINLQNNETKNCAAVIYSKTEVVHNKKSTPVQGGSESDDVAPLYDVRVVAKQVPVALVDEHQYAGPQLRCPHPEKLLLALLNHVVSHVGQKLLDRPRLIPVFQEQLRFEALQFSEALFRAASDLNGGF